MKNFDAKECYTKLIEWTRNWFNTKGEHSKAIIGMSGGKDSTITAKILVDALGKDRVIGVALPDEGQGLNDADKICEYLGIKFIMFPISLITGAIHETAAFSKSLDQPLTSQAVQNIPPRIRMTCLYMIAQTYGGFVVNTSNLSEDIVGYATLFGDSCGSVSLLGNLTVTEILEIGNHLNLPKEWVHKIPDDGLPQSMPDETKLGFTYNILDKYITGEQIPDKETKLKIDIKYKDNLFKMKIIHLDTFDPKLERNLKRI